MSCIILCTHDTCSAGPAHLLVGGASSGHQEEVEARQAQHGEQEQARDAHRHQTRNTVKELKRADTPRYTRHRSRDVLTHRVEGAVRGSNMYNSVEISPAESGDA